MLNNLVKDSELTRKKSTIVVSKAKKTTKPSANNVDIFSMLSKAQENFNTTRSSTGGDSTSGTDSKSSSVNGPIGDISAVSIGPDVTSQSVMDFFAKAKVRTQAFINILINFSFIQETMFS